jgi:uncharacterized membrane protein
MTIKIADSTIDRRKIEGKFYPLQYDEWLQACRELKPSERDVLYLVRCIDPYDRGMRISAAEIARRLSTPDRVIHRQTVSRALKELDRKGYIDLELIEVKINISSKGYWNTQYKSNKETSSEDEDAVPPTLGSTSVVRGEGREEQPPQAVRDDSMPENNTNVRTWCDETPRSIATHHDRSSHTTSDRHTPQAIVTHHTEAETQSQSHVHNSKTLKTYLEFIKTLSEDERENFLNFVRKQIQNLPTPVNDVEAWLASLNSAEQNRWEVYFEKFQASMITKSKASQERPIENFAQQQARKFREELEERKRTAREEREQELKDRDADTPNADAESFSEKIPAVPEANSEAEAAPKVDPPNAQNLDLDSILADYERNKRGQLPEPRKNKRFPRQK